MLATESFFKGGEAPLSIRAAARLLISAPVGRFALRRVGVRADRRRPRLPMEHRPGVNLRSARIAAVSAAEEF